VINVEQWSGIKFEWGGVNTKPWESTGTDCFGLTNAFHQAMGKDSLPMAWWAMAVVRDSRKTLASDYTERCFESDDRAVLLAHAPQTLNGNIALYHSQYGLAMAAIYNDQCLVFGPDLRSHWQPAQNLPIKSFWRIKCIT
jgi:hypothetical protein